MEDTIRNKLNKILIENTVRENENFILTVIPELQACVSFDQKHPHHHLDVWQHTLLTIDNLETDDLEVNMAALLHDLGKPYSYQEGETRHFKNHAEVSAYKSHLILQRLKYDASFIEDVCYLIETHDIAIDPDNLDNSIEMINKRLTLQYADAKAHNPKVVDKKVKKLDKIKEKINSKQRKR